MNLHIPRREARNSLPIDATMVQTHGLGPTIQVQMYEAFGSRDVPDSFWLEQRQRWRAFRNSMGRGPGTVLRGSW